MIVFIGQLMGNTEVMYGRKMIRNMYMCCKCEGILCTRCEWLWRRKKTAYRREQEQGRNKCTLKKSLGQQRQDRSSKTVRWTITLVQNSSIKKIHIEQSKDRSKDQVDSKKTKWEK